MSSNSLFIVIDFAYFSLMFQKFKFNICIYFRFNLEFETQIKRNIFITVLNGIIKQFDRRNKLFFSFQGHGSIS